MRCTRIRPNVEADINLHRHVHTICVCMNVLVCSNVYDIPMLICWCCCTHTYDGNAICCHSIFETKPIRMCTRVQIRKHERKKCVYHQHGGGSLQFGIGVLMSATVSKLMQYLFRIYVLRNVCSHSLDVFL